MAECLFCKKEVSKRGSFVIDVSTKNKIYFCNEFCYTCYGPSKVDERVLYMQLCDLAGVQAMTREMFDWYRGEVLRYDTQVLNDLIKTKKSFLKRKANEQKAKGSFYMLKTALGIALNMYKKHKESLTMTENTMEAVDSANIETLNSSSCTYINDKRRRNISMFL